MRDLEKAAFAAAALVIPAAVAASDTVNYTYDALGRVTDVSTTGGPNDSSAAATRYDPAGNRTSYSVSGAGAAGLASAPLSAPSDEIMTDLEEEGAAEEVPAALVEPPPPGGIPDESEPVVEIGAPEDGGTADAAGADR